MSMWYWNIFRKFSKKSCNSAVPMWYRHTVRITTLLFDFFNMSKYNQLSFCSVITIKTDTMILRIERKIIRILCCILLTMYAKLVCNSNEKKTVLYTRSSWSNAEWEFAGSRRFNLFHFWFSCHSKTRLWTEALISVFLFLINVTVQLILKMEVESVSFRISHQVILSEIKTQNLNYQNPS